MIIGIGCDIVDMTRFEGKQERLAKRILSKEEHEIYASLKGKRALEFLAGRFAAKEALIKAMDHPYTYSDFSILYQEEKPVVEIDGYTIHLSISHDGQMAMANAVVETCVG